MASKQESDMENEQNYTVEYVGNQYVYTNYCLSKCTTTQKCKVNTGEHVFTCTHLINNVVINI